MHNALRLSSVLRRTLGSALRHDSLNLAQSAAYSAIVALFPALIVSAATVALLPDAAPLKGALGSFFEQVLPSEALPLLSGYFVASPKSTQSLQALLVATLVSLTGGSSVLATLMEGLRRAEDLPNDCWTFWQRRGRALALVPLSLAPMLLATLLVVFGQLLMCWIAGSLPTAVQPTFLEVALLARWTVALIGVSAVTALIYHLGTPKPERWHRTLPGAAVATTMWFVSTLAFGWYVTRFANYGRIYGSLGAGIALLFWLYLIFFSVLCGAEFNAQFYRDFFQPALPPKPASSTLPNALG